MLIIYVKFVFKWAWVNNPYSPLLIATNRKFKNEPYINDQRLTYLSGWSLGEIDDHDPLTSHQGWWSAPSLATPLKTKWIIM